MAKKIYKRPNEIPVRLQEPVEAYQPAKAIEYKNIPNQSAGLNEAQLHLLQMLSFVKTEETLSELKQLISEFYLKQLDEQIDIYWEKGKISDDLLNEHLRTPYK